MLICGYLNTFPNTFWGDGIWYFQYEMLLAFVTVTCLMKFEVTCKRPEISQVLFTFIESLHFPTILASPRGFSVI